MLWYEALEYPRIRRTMADGRSYPSTYEAWRDRAETAEREYTANGARIVRVTIHPDVFRQWCGTNGIKRDADARAKYARSEGKEILRQQD